MVRKAGVLWALTGLNIQKRASGDATSVLAKLKYASPHSAAASPLTLSAFAALKDFGAEKAQGVGGLRVNVG